MGKGNNQRSNKEAKKPKKDKSKNKPESAQDANRNAINIGGKKMS